MRKHAARQNKTKQTREIGPGGWRNHEGNANGARRTAVDHGNHHHAGGLSLQQKQNIQSGGASAGWQECHASVLTHRVVHIQAQSCNDRIASVELERLSRNTATTAKSAQEKKETAARQR